MRKRYYFVSILVMSVGFLFMANVQPAHAINWSKCQVQQGETNLTAGQTTKDVAVTLADTTQAFLLSSASGDSTVQSASNHMVSGEIVNTTTIRFKRSGATGTAYVSYSLIQCYDHEFSVQAGTINFASADSSKTADISSVAPERTFVVATTNTTESTANEAQVSVTAALEGNNKVKVQRTVISSVIEVKYQVVTFAPETNVTVQTNEVTLGSGVAEVSSTLTNAIDRSRSWVYCTYDASNNGLMQTSIGCELDSTADNIVKIHRYSAAAYTNRVRYYVITWPADTVSVQHGFDSYDVSGADDTTRKDHDITIGTVSSTNKAFSYVTMTTKGTNTLFPRNRWIYSLTNRTTLRTSFWRADTADSDASYKYWQIVSFPSPYGATGWGWIGSSVDNTNGTALISFDCDNLNTYYGTSCGDGTGGTRYDYGVYLERGGCGATCAVTGAAWVGVYDTTDSQMRPLGMITFDPDVSSPAALPNALGDDVSTVGEDERSGAQWNEQTNELYGWARFTALADYEKNNSDVLSSQNNWGWIKLRGQVSGGSNTEYGVDFDPVAGTFAEGSWGWNDNGTAANGTTELEGSGFGWVRFDLGTSGTVSQAWLKTSQGDVYSEDGINVTTNPTTYGDFGSTYLILANGSVTNFSSEYGSVSTSTNLGTVPTDAGNKIYRGMLGSIHVNELIDHPVQPLYIYNGDCDDTWLDDFTNPLGGAVYYCTGDMTINNNLTFYNATSAALGAGTIIVGGNLYINDNVGYYNDTIDQNINNLASVAFIVQGRVEINPGVTNLVGAYIVLGDANPSVSGLYDFATGGTNSGGYNAPLELAGLVMARSFHFQRNSQGDANNPQPAEHIYYDGRIFANTPPGLEDFAAVLPSFN